MSARCSEDVAYETWGSLDADAFRDIMELYGERVIAAFVHDVKTIDPERLQVEPTGRTNT